MATAAMTLESKGPIVKPPTLKGNAQVVSLEVQSWPDIISATHWTIGDNTKVNGADFYKNELELGHIHLDGEVHLLLTTKLRNALVSKKIADPFPWGKDWVQTEITNQRSAKTAIWLFRLGYDRLNGVSDADLMKRIAAFA